MKKRRLRLPFMALYDRDGKKIDDVLDWAEKHEDDEYRVVDQTVLPDGKWVSTVWLGIDHNFGRKGPPLIFETMVFESPGGKPIDIDRYSTEEEARAGHSEMVAKLQRSSFKVTTTPRRKSYNVH